MNLIRFYATLLALVVPASAQIVITETYGYTIGSATGDIPDTGAMSVFSAVTTSSQITSLTQVRIVLNLSGTTAGNGWAGDMFVSVNRDLGERTAILINQPGVSSENPAGYGFDGWNVTFSDSALADIHSGQPVSPAAILTGGWQPDGRLDPADTARPASLAVFNGLPGNGTWYVNIADLADTASMTLHSWELLLTGYSPVPEPEHYATLSGVALATFAWLAKRRSAETGTRD